MGAQGSWWGCVVELMESRLEGLFPGLACGSGWPRTGRGGFCAGGYPEELLRRCNLALPKMISVVSVCANFVLCLTGKNWELKGTAL